jgi:transketolase
MRPKGVTASYVRKAEELARGIRRDMLTIVDMTKTPHIGPALSCVDILTFLYTGVMETDHRDPLMAGRDRFILSTVRLHCMPVWPIRAS